jgi:hypothetical protein
MVLQPLHAAQSIPRRTKHDWNLPDIMFFDSLTIASFKIMEGGYFVPRTFWNPC